MTKQPVVERGLRFFEQPQCGQLRETRSAPADSIGPAQVFRRFGAEEWDALRTRFNAGARVV